MEFDCKFNLADGPQSLLIVPGGSVKSHKKAQIEVQALKCTANCDLLATSGIKP